MRVRMKVHISGTRNGVELVSGLVLDVPDPEGDDLISQGYAEATDAPLTKEHADAKAPEPGPDPAEDGDRDASEPDGDQDTLDGSVEGGEATVPTGRRAARGRARKA